MPLHVGDAFSSIDVAKDAANRLILDAGQSYIRRKRQTSDSIRSTIMRKILAASL